MFLRICSEVASILPQRFNLIQEPLPIVPRSQTTYDPMRRDLQMKRLAIGSMLAMALATSAYAATTMSAAPGDSWTVTNYYKQSVYDPKESKIGDVDDVLVDKSGKITGLVVGVGGFLGAGEKGRDRSVHGREEREEEQQMVSDAR
jgi:sporulation protein YlmC with PRC-barrel domain